MGYLDNKNFFSHSYTVEKFKLAVLTGLVSGEGLPVLQMAIWSSYPHMVKCNYPFQISSHRGINLSNETLLKKFCHYLIREICRHFSFLSSPADERKGDLGVDKIQLLQLYNYKENKIFSSKI